MLPHLLFFLASLLGLAAATDNAGTYTLLHRTFGPGVSEQQFFPRATLDVATLQITPIPGSTDEFETIYEASKGFDGALYQLALRGPDADPLGERMDISSVKACHLPLAAVEHLTFHLDSNGKPFHMDYYLEGPPITGACPTKKQLRALGPELPLQRSNMTIGVRTASHPPLPELRVPLPMTEKGQPITPPPEKTFLQKYWIYIAITLGMLLFAGGAPEEEGGQQARSR